MSPMVAPFFTSSIVTGMMFCLSSFAVSTSRVEQRLDLLVVALGAHALRAGDLALGGIRIVRMRLDLVHFVIHHE